MLLFNYEKDPMQAVEKVMQILNEARGKTGHQ